MKKYRIKIEKEDSIIFTYQELFLSYTHAMAHAENSAYNHNEFKGLFFKIEIEQLK